MGDKLHGGSRAPFSRGARTAFVALSGLTIVGSLAGCSVAPSMSAAAAKQFAAWQASGQKPTHRPSTPTPSETPTLDPAGAGTQKPKPTSAATPKPRTTTPPKKSTPTPTPTPTKTVTPPAPATYTDGTYSSRGSYQSPGGRETLRVTLTLTHDIVTSLTVESVHVDSTAASYEAAFEGGINAVVVGKNIDSLNVGAVGGSSLTSVGFNAALAYIKGQATP